MLKSTTDPLRGRDILCFSHDWNGDPLSKTHLMRLLALENRVLWVNSIGYRTPSASRADLGRAARKLAAMASAPIRQVEPNLHVLNPIAIPIFGRSWVRAINRRLLQVQVRLALRKLGFQRPINWTFNPAAAIIAGSLGEDLLIYQCVDEYAAFSGVHAQALADLEGQLLRSADLVIVSAERLYGPRVRVNPRTVLVRHGVDHDHFRKALDPDLQVPERLAGLPRPILGYFGLIAADWVDLDLLAHVARRFASGSLVLIGKTTMDLSALQALPNVHLLGHCPYRDLPAYCKGFDVALVPFPINEATLHSNPLKVREYLAAGLPVVSTAIPEVESLGLCRIGANEADFVRQIKAALNDPGPNQERSESVQNQGWATRLEEIKNHLAAVLDQRKDARKF